MRKPYRYRLIAVTILLTVTMGAMAGAFEQVQLTKAWTVSPSHSSGVGLGFFADNGQLIVDSDRPNDDALFTVMGNSRQHYIRTDVFSEYTTNLWMNDWDYQVYNGEQLESDGPGGTWTSITITPNRTMVGPLPVFQHTFRVSGGQTTLQFADEVRTFKADEAVESSYTFTYLDSYTIDSELSPVPVAADSKYLQVPGELRGRLTELAKMIAGRETTPHGQIDALVGYLSTQYEYSYDYEKAHEGEDPVEHFLFNSPRGICTHFNSALVLLARCLDIPARLCSGYYVQRPVYDTVVYASQAHAYAEIKLGDYCWVTYDATPGSPSPTYVHSVTSSDKGTVCGYTYLDLNNNNVRDGADIALPGRSVALYTNDGLTMLDLTVSDSSGYYSLRASIFYGYFMVRTFVNESEMAVPSETVSNVVVNPYETVNIDFGYQFKDSPGGEAITHTAISSVFGSGGGANAGTTSFDKDSTITVTGTSLSDEGAAGAIVQVFLSTNGTNNGNRILIGEVQTDYVGGFSATCMCPSSLPLGNYLLTARARADDRFSSSEDQLSVVVAETTNIYVQGSAQFFADEGTEYRVSINGSSSGPGMKNVDVFIDLPGYGAVNTGDTGFVSVAIPSGEPATHVFSISYGGDANRSSCQATVLADGLENQVDVMTAQLVRGENASIVVRAHAGGLVRETEVTVTIMDADNFPIFNTTAVCGKNNDGMFVYRFMLSSGIELGNYSELITTSDGWMQRSNVTVFSRPELNVTIATGEITARLLDDRGNPIADQELIISINGGASTLRTDWSGEAGVTSTDTISNITVDFAGSSFFLPVGKTIRFETASDLMALILPISGVVMAIVLMAVGAKYGLSRRAGGGADDGTSGRGWYGLTSLTTERGLPLVWGEGETIEVKLKGKTSNLTLLLDGEARKVRAGDTITLALPKGEHIAEVRGLLGRRKMMIRVIDFREEISKIFLTANTTPSSTDAFRRGASAREFLSIAREKGEIADPGTLVEVFEQAEYSNHRSLRPDYESAYLSSRRLDR